MPNYYLNIEDERDENVGAYSLIDHEDHTEEDAANFLAGFCVGGRYLNGVDSPPLLRLIRTLELDGDSIPLVYATPNMRYETTLRISLTTSPWKD